jgi:hypothetical protein
MTSIPFKEKFILFPPRPEGSITPDTIEKYRGWVGQRKFNGSRNLIYVLPDGSFELWSRHRSPHKAYKVSNGMRAAITEFITQRLKPGLFYVFDSELMDAKTVRLKDRIVIWDVLVCEGVYLLGSTFISRYEKLVELAGNPTEHESDTGKKLALKINSHLWLSETFKDNLKDRFDEALPLKAIEGIMLKDPNGKLEFGVRESNNSGWLIRVRKKHKNYEF